MKDVDHLTEYILPFFRNPSNAKKRDFKVVSGLKNASIKKSLFRKYMDNHMKLLWGGQSKSVSR